MLVKDVSRSKKEVMRLLNLSSATAAWACRKSLARRISDARRSVGVGKRGGDGDGDAVDNEGVVASDGRVGATSALVLDFFSSRGSS